MPAKKRLTMRQLRTLLRLKHGGVRLSDRTIACQIGVARSTIQEYLARVEAAGLSWPLPDDVTDEVLEQLLFPRSGCRPSFRRRGRAGLGDGCARTEAARRDADDAVGGIPRTPG